MAYVNALSLTHHIAYRSKDLFTGDGHVVCDIGEDGWRHKVALWTGSLIRTTRQCCAFFQSRFDEVQHTFVLFFRYKRSHLCVWVISRTDLNLTMKSRMVYHSIETRQLQTYLALLRRRHEFLCEFFEDIFVDEDSGRCTTHLALVEVNASF